MKIRPGDLVTATDSTFHFGIVLSVYKEKKKKSERYSNEELYRFQFPVKVLWDTGQVLEENNKTICVIL